MTARRLIDRLAAEPSPGWLCLLTLERELEMDSAALRRQLQALVASGSVQAHGLRVYWRAA